MLVNEGGGIHVDGEGTVLLTETVQLDPRRNRTPTAPASRPSSPARSARRTPSGCRAASPATTTTSARAGTSTWSRRSRRPDACCCTRSATRPPRLRGLARELRAPREADGCRGPRFEIIDLPAPATLRDDEGFVDWSYVNHLVVNGGVIACGFGEPEADARAARSSRTPTPGAGS